ncbi:hypothetical protein BDD12DRAFT_898528 [Trichophaea hybrida]|nr:hypothetical protein BDD12DRAFT_898528 [Trichophaea hybrida]
MQTFQIAVLLASVLATASAAPASRCGFPSYGQYYPSIYKNFQPEEQIETGDDSTYYSPYKGYNNYHPYNYHPSLSKPAFYHAYDRQSAEYEETDASSENQNANENAIATDNLAGAKSENANENANLAKGGEAFGFGALESDNRNLLANENNIEVANANKNELGVEVANFNANENSAEQESAALAEVMNEDHAEFTDYQENETDNLNLNDNYNDRHRHGGRN